MGGIPQALGTYAALYEGNWHYVWKQPGLLGQGKTLETQVAAAQPQLRLTYRPLRPDPSEREPEQVTSGDVYPLALVADDSTQAVSPLGE